jgi:predicted amino acid racemase
MMDKNEAIKTIKRGAGFYAEDSSFDHALKYIEGLQEPTKNSTSISELKDLVLSASHMHDGAAVSIGVEVRNFANRNEAEPVFKLYIADITHTREFPSLAALKQYLADMDGQDDLTINLED